MAANIDKVTATNNGELIGVQLAILREVGELPNLAKLLSLEL